MVFTSTYLTTQQPLESALLDCSGVPRATLTQLYHIDYLPFPKQIPF